MSITYVKISENILYVQYAECIQNKNLIFHTRREFSREILYKNIAIIAIQHSNICGRVVITLQYGQNRHKVY